MPWPREVLRGVLEVSDCEAELGDAGEHRETPDIGDRGEFGGWESSLLFDPWSSDWSWPRLLRLGVLAFGMTLFLRFDVVLPRLDTLLPRLNTAYTFADAGGLRLSGDLGRSIGKR